VSECRTKFFLFAPNIKGEKIAQNRQKNLLNENNKFGFLS